MDQPPPQTTLDERPQYQHPLANYQFSAEELKVLQECNSESFFQRSLPLGTSLGLAAYFGVKNGFLQPSVKYGPAPKVIVGVIVGYFIGKFSYQQKCAEKIMRLPNSQLAEILRQRRQGSGIIPDQNLSRALTLAPFTPSQADIYTDEGMRPARSSALNLDMESRPSISGLDDIYRPSLDTPNSILEQDLTIEPGKPGTTYEDLRKKNREEHMKRLQNPYSRPLPPEAPVVTRQQKTTDFPSENLIRESEAIQRDAKKNKYGDTWSD